MFKKCWQDGKWKDRNGNLWKDRNGNLFGLVAYEYGCVPAAKLGDNVAALMSGVRHGTRHKMGEAVRIESDKNDQAKVIDIEYEELDWR